MSHLKYLIIAVTEQKRTYSVQGSSCIFCKTFRYIFRLCGVSPFHGKSYHEVLMKNKEGIVLFEDKYWSAVSPEGKDLVAGMVKKNPSERISAQEALEHKWFAMAHTKVGSLSSALENMRKYHNKDNEYRFNVGKIKPEFAMVTRTPLLASRFANNLQDSPLIISKNCSPSRSPAFIPIRMDAERIRVMQLFYYVGTNRRNSNCPYPGEVKGTYTQHKKTSWKC